MCGRRPCQILLSGTWRLSSTQTLARKHIVQGRTADSLRVTSDNARDDREDQAKAIVDRTRLEVGIFRACAWRCENPFTCGLRVMPVHQWCLEGLSWALIQRFWCATFLMQLMAVLDERASCFLEREIAHRSFLALKGGAYSFLKRRCFVNSCANEYVWHGKALRG